MTKHTIKILVISCLASSCGDDGSAGLNGNAGTQGLAGPSGNSGQNGLNSLIALTRGPIDSAICPSEAGVLIQSGLDSNQDGSLGGAEVTQSAFLCDGLTGPQGPIGVTPQYGINAVIDPCGDTPGVIDEVLLQFANGQLIASFSDNANGNNTRFAIIPPGNYIDTDGSNCQFTVHNDNSVTW